MLFGSDTELQVREARRRAGVSLHVSRQDFRAFRQELERAGVVKMGGSGKAAFLKKVL